MKHMLRCYLLLMFLFSHGVIAADKPNIILIVLDDLGWRDVGFMGNSFIETPQLDKLAAEGLVFDNAYSNAPNCAPSRAAIMSGQYAPRTDVYTMFTGDMGNEHLRRVLTPPNKMHLEPKVITIAEVLRSAGYRTAHIGKWNLGTGEVRGPTGQGFDLNIAGFRGGEAHNGYFAPYDLPGLEEAPAGEYLTDRLTAESVRFIEQDDPRPFFIHLAHFAPHPPFQGRKDLLGKYENKKLSSVQRREPMNTEFAAMIEAVDQGVGRIMAALKENGQLDNTLIILTSDNGGYDHVSYMEPLRGQKSYLYEGGIRVPMLWWWQGHIRANRSHEPVMGIDIFPTLLEAAGVTGINQPLDGVALQPLFSGKPSALGRDALFWYFPAYIADSYDNAGDVIFQQHPAVVVRKQEWKLIRHLDSDLVELYNLEKDPGETTNRVASEPAKAQELSTMLDQWLLSMQAPLPLKPNPAYDPDYNPEADPGRLAYWKKRVREWLDSISR